jgi:hypothetical protein
MMLTASTCNWASNLRRIEIQFMQCNAVSNKFLWFKFSVELAQHERKVSTILLPSEFSDVNWTMICRSAANTLKGDLHTELDEFPVVVQIQTPSRQSYMTIATKITRRNFQTDTSSKSMEKLWSIISLGTKACCPGPEYRRTCLL